MWLLDDHPRVFTAHKAHLLTGRCLCPILLQALVTGQRPPCARSYMIHPIPQLSLPRWAMNLRPRRITGWQTALLTDSRHPKRRGSSSPPTVILTYSKNTEGSLPIRTRRSMYTVPSMPLIRWGSVYIRLHSQHGANDTNNEREYCSAIKMAIQQNDRSRWRKRVMKPACSAGNVDADGIKSRYYWT